MDMGEVVIKLTEDGSKVYAYRIAIHVFIAFKFEGNVGWGVLGSFGSRGKDEIAQVVRRAEGTHKMVKNSKGLWVKQTAIVEEESGKGGAGRGRGNGIPVFNEQMSIRNSDIIKNYSGEDNDRYEDGDEGRSTSRYRSSRDRINDSENRDRSRSLSRDKERDKKKASSYHNHHDRTSNEDRHRARGRDRNRSRSRSRSRSRDRGKERGRYRERSRERSRGDLEEKRKYRRDDHDRRDRGDDSDRRSSVRKEDGSSGEEQGKVIEKEDSEEATVFKVTAIQVVNRFHDVYATDTLFAKDRIAALSDLFAATATIRSLKTDAEYLSGRESIGASFNKTMAAPVTVSKRVYIEPLDDGLRDASSSSSANTPSTSSISFVMDLHKAGTAPGLGDRAKDNVLLYRVHDAEINRIWGSADTEKLAADEDLSKEKLLCSKAWKLVSNLIRKERSLDEEKDAHYHNYDRMETWG